MSLNLITGCMRAGKTSELLRMVKRYLLAGKSVVVVTSSLDDRYDSGEVIVSHDGTKRDALKCKCLSEVLETLKKYDVVCVDEFQFFSQRSVGVADLLAFQGKTVYLACLDGTYQRTAWGNVSDLIPKVERHVKLDAVCSCGSDASFTWKEGVVTKEVQIEVGAEQYEAACRKCYYRKFLGRLAGGLVGFELVGEVLTFLLP